MTRETTPPDAPKAGVTLQQEDVIKIVKRALPKHEKDTLTIKALQSDASFNNRIYFIHIDDDLNPAYTLKVNGRFFGATKVENEICSLLLLKRYCYEIPVPRVIAWSMTGDDMTALTTEGPREVVEFAEDKVDTPGWILLTCLPGSKPDVTALSNEERESLATQVGAHVAYWRRKIPPSVVAGRLCFSKDPKGKSKDAAPNYRLAQHHLWSKNADPKPIYTIGVRVGGKTDSDPRLNSVLKYFRAHLERQVAVLETNAVFAATREQLLPVLRQFIDEDLPKLPIMRDRPQEKNFVFTWRDMAPRNTLITRNPLRVTGIVDFEFAGFCPAMEEFSQEWSPEDTDPDWSPFMYDCLLNKIRKDWERTPTPPHRLVESSTWAQWRNIYHLREHIAPWWIVQGEPTAAVVDVEQDVLKAGGEVQGAVRELRRLIEEESARQNSRRTRYPHENGEIQTIGK